MQYTLSKCSFIEVLKVLSLLFLGTGPVSWVANSALYSCSFFYRKHVVFGEVVKGHDVIDDIEKQEVDSKHRPLSDVRIVNCGELVLQLKSLYLIF